MKRYTKILTDDGMTRKAGGVVVRKNNGVLEVLLLYRAQLRDWTFPKGHVEQGEDEQQTAVREVEEETGLQVQILAPLPDNFYTASGTGEKVRCTMFLMKAMSGTERQEHPGDALSWMPLAQAVRRIHYANLRDFLTESIPTIEASA